MAQGIREYDPDRKGSLVVEEYHPNFTQVYFIPSRNSLLMAEIDPRKAEDYRTHVLDIYGPSRFLTFYPIWTFGDRDDFLKLKRGVTVP